MTRTTTALTGALILGVLSLTGCSSEPGAAGSESMSHGAGSNGASTDATGEYNDSDVTFAQGMIPHHQQTVEMAQLAEDRAEDPRILDLAQRIDAAQQPEIETLTTWLEEWGAEPADDADIGHNMGGMAPEEDLETLSAASGSRFDRLFIDFMLAHHTGAVGMAEAELANGRNDAAMAMAETVRDTQGAEIQEMEQLRDELVG